MNMDMTRLSSLLREAGVVGAGGAGFPSYAKLSDKTEVVLANCAECEPLLKLHRQLTAEHPREILQALSLVANTVGAREAVIGIKSEYKSAVDALNEYIGEFPLVRIHLLSNTYPMGDEAVLIYEATGRVVRPGGLPIECGAAVFNVETLYNIYRAVWQGQPVTEKLVTIAGEVENPVTVRVPVGTPLEKAVAMAGAITTPEPVFLIGGPMMGNFGSLRQPVTKTTSAVIVLPADHPLVFRKKPNIQVALRRAASSCCQCQSCTDLCPRHALGHPIEPHMFMRAAANMDTQNVKPFLNTMFCSSCGLCEMYSCPQGLSPRSLMAEYKAGLRKAGVKAPQVQAAPVSESREYRKAPEGRLMSRLGLKRYDHAAPLIDREVQVDRVEIRLSQHIGAPSVPVVKAGDQVSVGQMIAEPAQGLGVGIHASMNGTVAEVTDRSIVINSVR